MRRGAVSRIAALLLVGPTGSGKSPLGRILERRSGWVHLDFGELLREIVSGSATHGLSPDACEFVRGLVRANALFPEDAFELVGTLLESFLASRGEPRGLVLNGLPRHVSQASSLSAYVDVVHVAFLNSSAEVAAERVARRSRGEGVDHGGRSDDRLEDVRRKLSIFEARTRPLLEHYARQGVPVTELLITSAQTDEEQLAERLLQAGWTR